jgi:formylglycine-generating enzyme required for sulfatase activity
MNAPQGEKRVALVVGNGKYQKTSWLANPPNDAEKMVASLGRLGFNVLDGTNLEYASFAGRVRDFGRALREAHVALFFYAGHGLQVLGENYVVPVDASLEHEADVQLELIAVQTILASMEIGNRTSIVILDACRDNPLARNLARAIGTTRSATVSAGLGRLESGIGTYIAFATASNKVALDGDGASNSPFSAALLRHIETPGLEVTEVMRRVRRDVIAATEKTREGAQVPWDNSSLVAPFYFLLPPSGKTRGASPPNPAIVVDAAERDWGRWRLAEAEELAIIEAYIAKYVASEPIWAARARQRLEVVQALIAERDDQTCREREHREAEETRRREEQQEAEFRAKGLVKVDTWTPKGRERRWIGPGAGRDDRHVFRDFEHGPEMIVVPAGKFLMGSPKVERHHIEDERPKHRVSVPKPFAIGRYAITFAEWDAAVAAGGVSHKPDDQGWGRGDRPVINVSWEDAQTYLAWLRQATGQDYRLPSEAEWEYAARAGTTTPFWWGASIATDQANYDGNFTYGDGRRGEYRKKTLSVKSFDPNPWGLYQVHGNVWEWCEDEWHSDYAGKPEALKTNGGPWTTQDSSYRVLRGGSWFNYPYWSRSGFRSRFAPDFREVTFGFRVARTLSPL